MTSSGLISLIHLIHCPPNQPTVASSPAQKPQPPSNLSLTSFKGAFYLPVVSMCPAPSLPTAWNTNGVAVRWGQECCNSALPLKQVWGRPCFPGSLLLPGAVSLSDGMWNIHDPGNCLYCGPLGTLQQPSAPGSMIIAPGLDMQDSTS